MIKLKQILQEDRRKLRIFDFDDTLAKTDSYIYVQKADGTELTLDPGEYAVYKEQPGDKFDFRDFNKMLRNPRAIKKNMDLIKRALRDPENRVTVLTARALGYPMKHFFKTQHGIDPYIVPVAGADPRLKVKFIEDHIKRGYTDIFFLDDSPKNVAAVKRLKTKYPNIKLDVQLAK